MKIIEDIIFYIACFLLIFLILFLNRPDTTIQKLCSKKQYDFCEVDMVIYKLKGEK